MAAAPEEMLKNLLEDPSAMEKVSGMLQAFMSSEKKNDAPKNNSPLPFGLDNPETLMKIGRVWSEISETTTPDVNLLMAIKPYLNEKRRREADRAMQLLKLSKMSSLFHELNIL